MNPEQKQRIIGHFIEEAEEHLQYIDSGLTNLSQSIIETEIINELFRAAHSIKGGAAMLDLTIVQQIAHRFEDYFKMLQEHSGLQINAQISTSFRTVYERLRESVDHVAQYFLVQDDFGTDLGLRVEPLFAQTEQLLGNWMRAEGAIMPQISIAQDSSFSQQVQSKLDDMEQIFKREDVNATRLRLQGVCDDLLMLGDRSKMSGWQDVIGAAKVAITNLGNSYRTLAPLITRAIRSSKDLIEAEQFDQVKIPIEMRSLLPANFKLTSAIQANAQVNIVALPEIENITDLNVLESIELPDIEPLDLKLNSTETSTEDLESLFAESQELDLLGIAEVGSGTSQREFWEGLKQDQAATIPIAQESQQAAELVFFETEDEPELAIAEMIEPESESFVDFLAVEQDSESEASNLIDFFEIEDEPEVAIAEKIESEAESISENAVDFFAVEQDSDSEESDLIDFFEIEDEPEVAIAETIEFEAESIVDFFAVDQESEENDLTNFFETEDEPEVAITEEIEPETENIVDFFTVEDDDDLELNDFFAIENNVSESEVSQVFSFEQDDEEDSLVSLFTEIDVDQVSPAPALLVEESSLISEQDVAVELGNQVTNFSEYEDLGLSNFFIDEDDEEVNIFVDKASSQVEADINPIGYMISDQSVSSTDNLVLAESISLSSTNQADDSDEFIVDFFAQNDQSDDQDLAIADFFDSEDTQSSVSTPENDAEDLVMIIEQTDQIVADDQDLAIADFFSTEEEIQSFEQPSVDIEKDVEADMVTIFEQTDQLITNNEDDLALADFFSGEDDPQIINLVENMNDDELVIIEQHDEAIANSEQEDFILTDFFGDADDFQNLNLIDNMVDDDLKALEQTVEVISNVEEEDFSLSGIFASEDEPQTLNLVENLNDDELIVIEQIDVASSDSEEDLALADFFDSEEDPQTLDLVEEMNHNELIVIEQVDQVTSSTEEDLALADFFAEEEEPQTLNLAENMDDELVVIEQIDEELINNEQEDLILTDFFGSENDPQSENLVENIIDEGFLTIEPTDEMVAFVMDSSTDIEEELALADFFAGGEDELNDLENNEDDSPIHNLGLADFFSSIEQNQEELPDLFAENATEQPSTPDQTEQFDSLFDFGSEEPEGEEDITSDTSVNVDNLSDFFQANQRITASQSQFDVDFDDLELILGGDSSSQNQDPLFDQLESLINGSMIANGNFSQSPGFVSSNDDFADLEALLGGGNGESTVIDAKPRRVAERTRNRDRATTSTMKVDVKNLDSLNNLVGELVVNRNLLETDNERLQQFISNMLHQVQDLSDVSQRMRDEYDRSLMENSLDASRPKMFTSSGGMSGYTGFGTNQEVGLDNRFEDIELDRYSNFHILSQEIIELIVKVRESASDIEFVVSEAEQVSRQLGTITTQIQDDLKQVRMLPFTQISERLPRGVRDRSLQAGKKADIVVFGGDTLIDKSILEQLQDPMVHLINNAIDHGIEDPLTRNQAGKEELGVITVRAYHQGNQTVIAVSDDGAGIDPQKVIQSAVKKGLRTSNEVKSLTNEEIYDLIFEPGFSTAAQADIFKGRGVGMDVVKSGLEEIKGSVHTESAVGKGTTFTIRLPLTLSVSKAMFCISDRNRIAFPVDGFEDVVEISGADVEFNSKGQPCLPWRDTILPFRPLPDLLPYNRQMSRTSIYNKQEDDVLSVIILRNEGNYLALQVDQFLGENEIVIKNLEGPVPKPPGIAGATILGDGKVMAIANVLELFDIASGRMRVNQQKMPAGMLFEDEAKHEPLVLIVDDSVTVRELLSLTFSKIGYRVEQAKDGQDAWEKLRAGLPCDLIFCDVEMPRMDGFELLSRIQKDNTLNKIPISMLTSRGADRHRQTAIQLGATAYFTKPYLEEEILSASQRMMKGERLIG